MNTVSAHGYTLAELIAVIAILGVLAAVATPRFLGRNTFEARGFSDQAQMVVRHAQKVAIAQRRAVHVVVTSSRIGACYDSACTARVAPPVGYLQITTPWGTGHTGGFNCDNDARWLCAGAPDGVAISPGLTFTFDALGRPSFPAAQTVTIAGDVARSIVIERETGYVHP